MKFNKTFIIIIAAAAVLLFFMNGKKEASPGLDATRVFSGGIGPNHVLPGQTLTATYDTVTSTGYMAVVETVPTNWVSSVAPSADGKVRVTADSGMPVTITWTAPSTVGQYTFYGQFFVNPDTEWTNFATDTISVCGSQDHSLCYSGDRYWYTSCGDLQGVREDCVAGSPTPWGNDFCDAWTVKHSRTTYTEGCIGDGCTQTLIMVTEVNTAAPHSASGVCLWHNALGCVNGLCQQNSAADYNFDGCVHDTEFPTAVADWKGAQTNINDANFPTVVAKWKSQEYCGG